MAFFEYENVAIKGISAAVPKRIFNNETDSRFFTEEQAKSVVSLTGIKQRRIADVGMCSSDLCFAAADKLLNEMEIDRQTIDVIIFVSQTPDYRSPATGIILQDRLGCPTTTAAFDVNLGCSGFIYGLNQAFSFALQPAIRKVLLLNGETRTKVYSMQDKSAGLLFGDGGSACLIERDPSASKAYFSLHSDGKRFHYIIVKGGGYRYPSSLDTVTKKTYSDGSIRSDEHGIMDGEGIFDFTIRDVYKSILNDLRYLNDSADSIDYFIFHQANKFITDHIAKKLRVPSDKVPYSLDKFGNVSSVSIPLTMVSALNTILPHNDYRVFMSGFGVGLSWGNAIMNIKKPYVAQITEI